MVAQGGAAPGEGPRVEEGAQSFLGHMAERLGMAARHASIYGEPVTNAGTTVITVAKARWGFGGGAGSGTGPGRRKAGASAAPASSDEVLGGGEGAGGGGGVSVSPVGYIEITAEGARFHRIWDAQTVAMLAVCSGLALALVLRGVRKLVR